MKVKLLGLLTVIAVLLAAFVIIDRRGDDGTPAGKPVTFSISPPQALAGQSVTVAGKVTPPGRAIVLERKQGEQYVEQMKVTAGEAGAYSFSVPVAADPVVYRVQAPRMKVGEATVRSRTSSEFTLVAAKRGGSIELAPPVGQSMDGKTTLSPGFVEFVPANDGAKVEVQRQVDGKWSTFETGTQDAVGRFSFLVETAEEGVSAPLRALTKIGSSGEPLYTPTTKKSPFKLVWSDEFSGTELSQEWQTRPAVLSSRPCTTVVREMSTVSDGFANISAARDPSKPSSKECPNGWLLNSQITTEAAKTFTYGTFAAKINFQKPAGVHGGFFLYYPPGVDPNVPATDEAGSRGAEIDAVEYFGERNRNEGITGGIQNSLYWDRKKADGTLELAKAGSRKDVSKYLRDGRTPADDFHIYSVDWTPTEYVFRFDGHETARIDRGISRRAEYPYLSMLTSAFEAKYLDRTELPATMQVDWVRVWQR